MKRLLLTMLVLFLCGALHAQQVAKGKNPSSRKAGEDGIEFMPRLNPTCSVNLGAGHANALCYPFQFLMNKKIKNIDVHLYFGKEIVGHLTNKHDPDIEVAEVELLGKWFDEGLYSAYYEFSLPFKPFRVVEKYKGNLARSTVPFYDTEIAQKYGDAYDYWPMDYNVVMKITTVDGKYYEHAWPLKIVYLNDSKGMFDGDGPGDVGIAEAKQQKEIIKQINANLYRAMEGVKSLEVFDMSGRKLKQGKEVSLEDFSKMIVIIRAVGENGEVLGTKKVNKN